jgi:hypothetical protein
MPPAKASPAKSAAPAAPAAKPDPKKGPTGKDDAGAQSSGAAAAAPEPVAAAVAAAVPAPLVEPAHAPEPVAVPTGATSEAKLGKEKASIDDVLAALDLDGLPNRESFERPVVAELKGHMSALTAAYVYYCKTSTECVSFEQATRLPVAGVKKLAQTLGLESTVFPIDSIVRIFGKCAKGGDMPATTKEVGGSTSLDFRGFLSFVVQVGFYRLNARYGPFAVAQAGKDKSKEAGDSVNVAALIKTFLAEIAPKLPKRSVTFANTLAADRMAQQVLQQYGAQLEHWRSSLLKAASGVGGDADAYLAFVASLEKAGIIGSSMIRDSKEGGFGSKEVTLPALAARHALLDAHEPNDVALGKLPMGLQTLLIAVGQCGDKKLDAIEGLPLAWRMRATVQALVGETEFGAAVSEALSASPVNSTSNASAEEIEAAQQAAIKKSWRMCWKMMVFKDLVGYPLWETQLHDVLQAAFFDLHKIFTYYCSNSVAGSGSIASATRIGVMEFLALAKDTEICNKEYKTENLTKEFYVANTQAMMKNSSSADRKQLPGKEGKGKGGGKGSVAAKKEAKATGKDAGGRKLPMEADKKGGQGTDQELSLYEFVNVIVRIGFARANPQWGSKYNKRELTPVPESVQLLLDECILPKAKRDTSYEFKKLLACDGPTQAVLAEYREQLQNWVRPILHRARRPDNPNPQMTYKMWVALMDGPDPETREITGPKPPCPKMVGEWTLTQESQITGDERTAKKNVLEFKCELSIPKCRWNFLRSQTVDQMGADEAAEGENSDFATLDFSEMLECIARCGVDKYSLCMKQWLPSHNRYMMQMSDAVRAFIQNLLSIKSEQVVMYELTVIKADRFDAAKFARKLDGQTPAEFKLFKECWKRMALMDVHHFPLWEKGVHDCLQRHFAPLQRVFSHYTKGISGIDSAADALEMELEEFHDFVKDAKLETKMINFTTMTIMFAKANATNTAEAFEQRMKERSNSVVQKAKEDKANADNYAEILKGRAPKKGAFPDVLPDRFAAEYPEWGSSKAGKRPDNRLVLFEFLSCLVRIAFQRANPKFGQYDNKRQLVPLPGCLERMLVDVLLPNAKQDMSSLFREEIANNHEVQTVLAEYRDKLKYWYNEVTRLTSLKGVSDGKLTMEAWDDIVKGYKTFKKSKTAAGLVMVEWKPKPGEPSLPDWALVGDIKVNRESEITGDERTKEVYSCRLTLIQTKYAFLNSQGIDQMTAGDATNDDAMATLDFDEFAECCCRCARDKYDEVKPMTLAMAVKAFLQNLLGEKGDEAAIRDYTYIKADRFDWHQAKPLKGQTLAAHRKWLDVWQLIEIADLHYFPLWEKEVHDCLQLRFADLTSIFSHYSKSIGGSTTAEDAVEMTMTEFKDVVKDTQLETKDYNFATMCNQFIKANALNTNEVRDQRINERKSAESKQEGPSDKASKPGPKREKSAKKLKDQEMDQELVLYEFIALLVRISFWRANPYHGIHKLANKLVPLPDCLVQMLDEVVLPTAKRDDSALFRERLQSDKKLLGALAFYDAKLKVWWDKQTQSMFLREGTRKIQFQQWQDLLKNRDDPGQNLVGNWEVRQESEITGDDRCKIRHKCGLSLPQAKMAFMNSQSLDQMSAGVATDSDAMTTLDFDEFKEALARVGIEKYKSVKAMDEAAAIKGFIANLLREKNEEEVLVSATLIRADRFDWKRYSKPLPGEKLSDFKKWLAVWQRLELMDIHHFPLWEKGVHDLLQKHFKELSSCFLGYTRSISEDSAEDALEMSMGEFKDFVEDCGLETKQVGFALMTNMFVKANAVNSAQVRQQHADERRNAEGKEHEKKIGEKGGEKAAAKVAGKNDGTEAKMDQELVLYEFLSLLVRISFQRANPTFGNFGDKSKLVELPGCLERMIIDEILPRARRDNALAFRETLYAELSVQTVIAEYRDKMRVWYDATTSDDSEETDITDKLGFKQWLRVCKDGSSGNAAKETPDRNPLVGIWTCHRESDITGDPNCRTEYNWRLSVPQIKAAFMDSQGREQMEAAQSSSTDEMTVLDFDEFLECVARCGVDKYKGVKEMSPAQAVKALMQNMLGEAEEEEVVIAATYIHAERFDAERIAKPLPSDGPGDFEKWMDCWKRIEIMDMHHWPLWEDDVFNMLQPLFKELQLIFLAYTRSISEDSAEDAMEMDMGEFHDFVVDVGLETKQYTFDVMCNQFIKANATNTAQVREQHMQGRKNNASKDDLEEQKKAKAAVPDKIKGKNDGTEAKKDAELVLYEFIGMLVRISFWRCNPKFGTFGNNDEVLAVPACLSKVLNEIILPKAKRETSGQFRTKHMQDPALLKVLNEEYAAPLLKWYKDVTSDDTKSNVITDKLTFEDWLRVLNAQDLIGVWEVEQLSEITGDPSCKANIKCRLSIPTCKAAFMDSQKMGEMGVAQGSAVEASAVLDFDEFKECVARVGTAKYSAVKAMTPAMATRAMIQNMIGERDELTVLREDTYIRAERFDWKHESKALPGMSTDVHQRFMEDFGKIQLDGLYGFPTFEKEVHDTLLEHYVELKDIFGAYCKTIGVIDAAANAEMDLEEFKDFVLDVRLETKGYTFEQMGAAFNKANQSGKGLAGPPPDAQLQFYEWLGVLCRTSFASLNPTFGELLAGDGEVHDLVPVALSLMTVLETKVLPDAHREGDAAAFKKNVMAMPEVQGVLSEMRGRLQKWWSSIPFDAAVSSNKLGLAQWVTLLQQLNVLGSTRVEQGSDVVGDPSVGTVHVCRLSAPQAKAAFANSQTAADGSAESILCDFDEILEAIARCGVDKYRNVKAISKVGAVRGMIENILGDADEDAVVTRHTYVFAERFDAASGSSPGPSMSKDEHHEFLGLWSQMQLSKLHGFPLWEREVHFALLNDYGNLKSIFRAYAAGSLDGNANDMDMEEFHDFILECDLPTAEYGFDTMSLQYSEANQGSGDRVLELHEFLTMLVRIAFYRANPRSGMINVKRTEGHKDLGAEAVEVVPLPGCLTALMKQKILPLARRDNAAEFKTTVLVQPDVASVLAQERQRLRDWWELASGGKDKLEISRFTDELERALLYNDVNVADAKGGQHRCRFSVPHAKAAFCASCAEPMKGMDPEEVYETVARCGMAKYAQVTPLGAGQKVRGFIRNLLGEADEEEIVQEATGGPPVPPKPPPKQPKGVPPKAAAAAPPKAEPPPPAPKAASAPAPSAPVAAQTPTDSARPKLGSAPRPAAVPVIAPPPPDPDSSEDEEEEEEEEGGDLDEAEELE